MTDIRALQQAVAEGVIDAIQAERIALIEAELPPLATSAARAPAPARAAEDGLSRDPENLRFVRGFADIFVTMGLLLLLGPAIYFSELRFQDTGMVAAVVAVGAWLLAEYFTRVRMMALPSIVLLAVFAAASAVFFADLIGASDAEQLLRIPGLNSLPIAANPSDPTAMFGLKTALAGVLTALAVTLHYLRFRVPIAIAAGTAALVGVFLAGVTVVAPDLVAVQQRWIVAGCGVAVFLLAMRFDMSDPERVTRRTDIAFWLHVLAAPLIVHPALSAVAGGEASSIGAEQATGVLTLFAAIGLVSVIIDRRSFLVAGLSYAGYAFWSLLGGAGIEDSALPGTLFALGALILLLSAGWQMLRRFLLIFVPAPISRRLPATRT